MSAKSPSTDTGITQTYSSDSLADKMKNKTALQKELGLTEDAKAPVVCLPIETSEKTNGPILKEILAGLMELPVQLIILGKGSSDYGTYLTSIAKDNPERIGIVKNDDVAIRKMYAAADMALFLTDPADHKELRELLTYGVVPVSPETRAIDDYNPNQETGEAFIYGKPTPWLSFSGVVRALETFKFPYDWKTLQKAAMEKAEVM